MRLLWEHTGAHIENAVSAVEELVAKASSPWERAELRRRGKAALASLFDYLVENHQEVRIIEVAFRIRSVRFN